MVIARGFLLYLAFMKTFSFLLGIFSFALFSGCSNDLDINAPYKEITVVYGLLNGGDSVQYIKINKAFLSKTRSALEVAQDPDSLYHNERIKVNLVQYKNGNRFSSILLDTAFLPHETGTFAGPNQLFYKTPKGVQIDVNSSYGIEISRNDNGKMIAQSKEPINVVGNFKIDQPASFDTTPPYFIFFYNGNYFNQLVQWEIAKNADMYDLVIRFFYDEVDTITHDSSRKYLDWKVFQSRDAGNENKATYVINGKSFYHNLNILLSPRENTARYMLTHFDVNFYVAGKELGTYIRLNAPNYFLTDISPDYTNIENGVGIFSSRYLKKLKGLIDYSSLKRIGVDPETKHLGFRVR